MRIGHRLVSDRVFTLDGGSSSWPDLGRKLAALHVVPHLDVLATIARTPQEPMHIARTIHQPLDVVIASLQALDRVGLVRFNSTGYGARPEAVGEVLGARPMLRITSTEGVSVELPL